MCWSASQENRSNLKFIFNKRNVEIFSWLSNQQSSSTNSSLKHVNMKAWSYMGRYISFWWCCSNIRATGGLSRFVTSPKRHQNHVRRLRVERPSVASRPKSEYRVSKKADSRTPARASLPRGRQYSEQLINTWRTSAAKSSTDSYALSARFFLMVPKSMGLCTKWRYSGFWKRWKMTVVWESTYWSTSVLFTWTWGNPR